LTAGKLAGTVEGGDGKSPFFHRKTRGVKTDANSSAAMANAVTAKFSPSIDRKKGRFLGLFCRKTGVRHKLFNTLLCVFTGFWDCLALQVVVYESQAAAGHLQNKSCLKTYRRFFVRSRMCLNKPVKVEMTGRDEGCGRCAAPRAAALLSRNHAVARDRGRDEGLNVAPIAPIAPISPQGLIGTGLSIKANQSQSKLIKANQSETCGSKRHPAPFPSRQSETIWCNLLKDGAIPPQPDCNPSRGIAPNCTKLHQIAVNCA
jgi:hypothetical protein